MQAADTVVNAARMVNFGISSKMKNWIDTIARAGATPIDSAAGPVGLLTGKKVYVVLTVAASTATGRPTRWCLI